MVGGESLYTSIESGGETGPTIWREQGETLLLNGESREVGNNGMERRRMGEEIGSREGEVDMRKHEMAGNGLRLAQEWGREHGES